MAAGEPMQVRPAVVLHRAAQLHAPGKLSSAWSRAGCRAVAGHGGALHSQLFVASGHCILSTPPSRA